MKKLLALLLILTFIISGCSFFKKKEPQTAPTPKQVEKQPPKEEKKDYILGLQTPVEGAKEWADRYKPYEGVFVQKKGDYRIVLITQGEKFAKGYEVNVKKVEKRDDKWVIETKITQPTSEDYAGGSVYPYELVSIINDEKPVEVVKTADSNSEMTVKTIEIPEGKQFAVSKNFIVFSPLEGEKISSPVKLVGKARVFEATFRIIIEDGNDILADKSLMSDAGAPAWGNFDITLPYEKPTNPVGSIIFAYPNMKDGTIVEELVLPVKF